MQVILLERVENLGGIGDEVKVRDGFARNYLLPQKKALRANEANRKVFEARRAEIEARNAEARAAAEKSAKKIDGESYVLIRQAGEAGQLYGSVSTRDIAIALSEGGFKVDRNQIVLNIPIKSIGMHKMQVELHGEVEVEITVHVARKADEAARQARGEDLTVSRTDDEEERAQAAVEAEKFFEKPAEGEGEGEQPAEAAAGDEDKPARKAKKEKAAGE